MQELHVVSWNVTRRCNLNCTHCYLPADTRSSSAPSSELGTPEALHLIDRIADVNPETLLILSGGEPLLRTDIYELAAHATRTGIMVVLGSNGTFIDANAAREMKKCGVSGISISLDSVTPQLHDEVRLVPGAWDQAVEAIRLCNEAGLSVQINTVVTRRNIHEMRAMFSYASSLGAKVFSPFFLVCTGRGEELTDLSPQQYEHVLQQALRAQDNFKSMMIRTRCAPTVRRIIAERDPKSPLLKMGTGQCMAGRTYCRITPEGDVTPCPYFPLSGGNVRITPFKEIWSGSQLFHALRKPALKGKCGACEYREVCGGCRARALATKKDYLGEDAWCDYRPKGGAVMEQPIFQTNSAVEQPTQKPGWTPEAEERLKRVPFFVRGMVRSAVESYATRNQICTITPEMMEELKRKTNMGGMSGHHG
jgi:radical SAM protein with 4Fe4S-binding SPASM domain